MKVGLEETSFDLYRFPRLRGATIPLAIVSVELKVPRVHDTFNFSWGG